MRRITTTLLALFLFGTVWAATLTVSTPAQWAAAKPVAGDVVALKADISLPCDTALKANVTYDLGTHTVTFPKLLPDGVRPSRGFCVDGGGIVVKNGTVKDAGWCFYAFYSGKGWAFQDIKCEGVKTFLKLSATPTAISEGVSVRNVTVNCVDAQYTILDIGPGRCSGVVVDGYRSYAPVNGANNTGADGIALENPTDTPIFRNVVVDGAAGDAFDIKGPAFCDSVYATNATRQTLKVWGRKGMPSRFTNCVGVNSGMGGMCNAGVVTMTDCYFEGGTSDSTAFFWGVNKVYDATRKDQWGNVDDYGCGGITAAVTGCKFIRHSGTSVLLTAETGAAITFDGCTFWQTGHPNLYVGPIYVSTDNAKAGKWPAGWSGSVWTDVAVPAVPGAVVIEPPIVDPPPPPQTWALTEADWKALQAKVAAVEARNAELLTWQKRLADSFK